MGATGSGRVRQRHVEPLRRALLDWYDEVRRALPWRADADPYRVWVAEVMLQQTRIAVVEPVYQSFLQAFPTQQDLAAASEDEVLSQWSGLGYYERARSLHRAAQQLSSQGAEFPREYAAARNLPGVGEYTAAAVLSIAYGEAHAAVDGNVIRVLSRLRRLGLPGSDGEPHGSVAEEMLDPVRPGDWNQAIMELGETVCLPSSPECGRCPVSRYCEAFCAGAVDRHPPTKPKPSIEKVECSMVVLRAERGRFMLERGVFPYLPKMWLPLYEPGDLPDQRSEDVVREIRHAITRWSFLIRVVDRPLSEKQIRRIARGGSGERRIFNPEQLQGIGRSSLLEKALDVSK